MDRQTFLAKLLESKNTIPVGKGWQHCHICKEKFVDHSDGAEEPEKQVHLPCHKKHTMGTACIIKWLEQHNTCPLCREELFPAEVAELDSDDEDDDSMNTLTTMMTTITPPTSLHTTFQQIRQIMINMFATFPSVCAVKLNPAIGKSAIFAHVCAMTLASQRRDTPPRASHT